MNSMKTRIAFISLLSAAALSSSAQIYTGKSHDISFFSDGPIEDIYAVTKSAQFILSATKNEVAIKITVKGFDFDKELMEEHFNEKYMETDKKGPKDAKGNDTYPNRYATFSGKINETVDYKKDGVYKVTVTGKLYIHGVEKERTISGTITVKGSEVYIESKFTVALKDHKIEIPTLVAQNIAETVDVTIKSTLILAK